MGCHLVVVVLYFHGGAAETGVDVERGAGVCGGGYVERGDVGGDVERDARSRLG